LLILPPTALLFPPPFPRICALPILNFLYLFLYPNVLMCPVIPLSFLFVVSALASVLSDLSSESDLSEKSSSSFSLSPGESQTETPFSPRIWFFLSNLSTTQPVDHPFSGLRGQAQFFFAFGVLYLTSCFFLVFARLKTSFLPLAGVFLL